MRSTLRVLVVDDEPALRRTTRRLLQLDDHEVFDAPDGAEALQVLARESIDVVLTDLYMPNVDGFELIRKLRKAGRTVPSVIAVSGADWKDNPGMQAMAIHLGVAATLTKPYTREELRHAVYQAQRANERGPATETSA